MKAIVLPGGGSFGAWQVGVMQALMAVNSYDIITGISVGAINGGFLSMYPKEQQKEGVDLLAKHWDVVTTRKVRKKWFGWPLSVPFKRSVYDSTPLQDWVRGIIQEHRIGCTPFRCGMVNMISGEYEAPVHPTVDDILASSAYPGFLLPVETRGAMYFDGGVRHVSPLSDAIKMGATLIDVVLPSSLELASESPTKTIPTLIRALQIQQAQIMQADLRLCRTINRAPQGNERQVRVRLTTPTENLLGSVLTFEPDDVRHNIREGRKDGWRTSNKGFEL